MFTTNFVLAMHRHCHGLQSASGNNAMRFQQSVIAADVIKPYVEPKDHCNILRIETEAVA